MLKGERILQRRTVLLMRTSAAVGLLLLFTLVLTLVETRSPAHGTNGVLTCPFLISLGSCGADAPACPYLRGMQDCPGETPLCPNADAHSIIWEGGTSCPYLQPPVPERDRSTMDETQAGRAGTAVTPIQAARIARPNGINAL